MVDQVLTTHTHMDRPPVAWVLKERTGCRVFGWPAPDAPSHDKAFSPMMNRGTKTWLLPRPGFWLLHARPRFEPSTLLEQELLFAGDHIMQAQRW